MTPKCISLIMGLNMKDTPSVVAAQFLDVVQGSDDAGGCAGIKTQHNLNILTLSAAAGVKHL